MMSASALESPVRGIECCGRGSDREDTSEDLVLGVGGQKHYDGREKVTSNWVSKKRKKL